VTVVTAAAIVVAGLLMPFVYGLVAFRGDWSQMMKEAVLEHVVFNTAANLAVMASAIRLSGRLDQKLTGVFRRTAAANGALAFLTLLSRHYYSTPMLLVGVAASALLGSAVVLIQQRVARRRVGVLGPWLPILDEPALGCEPVAATTASIQPYDLLLVTQEGDLSPTFAATVSRALIAGKRVRHISEFMEEIRGVTAIEPFDLEHLPEGGLTSYRSGKRMLDVLAALLLAPLVLPVIAIAGVGIWLTMGRPVFFSQARVGQGGHVFSILKLRTMRPPGTAGSQIATAIGDDRVTPFGRWLRRLHIDELPQVWNVLAGEMSLVGPRPEQPELAETYARQVPAFAYRQLVRPGITGWAQVRAGYAADLAETRVKLGYDLFYLKHFSLGLDVQICARTIWTLLSGGGVR